MELKEIAVESAKNLIFTYSRKPQGKKKKFDILYDGFEQLPQDTKKLIKGILNAVYNNDLEIIRKACIEKLELFLGLIADELKEIGCQDVELQQKINETRTQLASAVNKTEISEEEMGWLRQIGLLPIEIFELATTYNISEVIAELKKNISEYKLILGDEKYIVNILKMNQGFDKLRRLLSFSKNYDSKLIKFDGPHLVLIIFGSDWEEKLAYFENFENLKRLTNAGFNSYNLALMVFGADWREKLQYFEDPRKLKLLTDAGFNGSHLAIIVFGSDWREKLAYFENSENLKKLTDAGFNGSHLATIVFGSDWKEKLEFIVSEACLSLLNAPTVTPYRLSKLLKKKNWRAQLRSLGMWQI